MLRNRVKRFERQQELMAQNNPQARMQKQETRNYIPDTLFFKKAGFGEA